MPPAVQEVPLSSVTRISTLSPSVTPLTVTVSVPENVSFGPGPVKEPTLFHAKGGVVAFRAQKQTTVAAGPVDGFVAVHVTGIAFDFPNSGTEAVVEDPGTRSPAAARPTPAGTSPTTSAASKTADTQRLSFDFNKSSPPYLMLGLP